MITVAITGGIGSGKTAVTDYLEEKGYKVIDADKMAREITGVNGKAIPYIIEQFGYGYINEDGSMNRKAMRDLVFQNPDAKKVLEAGTTQVVIDDIKALTEEEASKGTQVLFFAIPLLFENNSQDDYDRVWLVTADYDTRCQRVQKRDGIEPEIIKLIMGSQASDDERVNLVDEVIKNNGTIEELHTAIDSILNRYEVQICVNELKNRGV